MLLPEGALNTAKILIGPLSVRLVVDIRDCELVKLIVRRPFGLLVVDVVGMLVAPICCMTSAFDDLSLHCVTLDPDNVIADVSAASNHRTQLEILVGKKGMTVDGGKVLKGWVGRLADIPHFWAR